MHPTMATPSPLQAPRLHRTSGPNPFQRLRLPRLPPPCPAPAQGPFVPPIYPGLPRTSAPSSSTTTGPLISVCARPPSVSLRPSMTAPLLRLSPSSRRRSPRRVHSALSRVPATMYRLRKLAVTCRLHKPATGPHPGTLPQLPSLLCFVCAHTNSPAGRASVVRLPAPTRAPTVSLAPTATRASTAPDRLSARPSFRRRATSGPPGRLKPCSWTRRLAHALTPSLVSPRRPMPSRSHGMCCRRQLLSPT